MIPFFKDFKTVRYFIGSKTASVKANENIHIGLTEDKSFVVIQKDDENGKKTYIPFHRIAELEK